MKKIWPRILLIVSIVMCASLLAGRPWAEAAAAPRARQQEEAKRDAWQRPDEVFQALGVSPGSAVADVGCGDGYFVFRLARRVGAEGVVYAEDVDDKSLLTVRRRVEKEKLVNVRSIEGSAEDPNLPVGVLDVVLVVNAYHEFLEYDAMLKAILRALKPGGRLGIIDAAGDERHTRAEHQSSHTITEKLVMEDAARNGLKFHSREPGFTRPDRSRRDFFFLIFERPAS